MAVGANPNLTVTFKADLRQLNRALRDAKKRVSEYADALARLGKSDLVPPQVIQKLDHYNKAVSNASREMVRAKKQTQSYAKSLSNMASPVASAVQPLKELQDEVKKTSTIISTEATKIRGGLNMIKFYRGTETGIGAQLFPGDAKKQFKTEIHKDLANQKGALVSMEGFAEGNKYIHKYNQYLQQNSQALIRVRSSFVEATKYAAKYNQYLARNSKALIKHVEAEKKVDQARKSVLPTYREVMKAQTIANSGLKRYSEYGHMASIQLQKANQSNAQSLNIVDRVRNKIRKTVNKVTDALRRQAQAQAKITREVIKSNKARANAGGNLWKKYTSAEEIQRAQALNQSTKAYRRSGMAMTQFAYAIDDAQYGLRGIQNNLQQMLVVMGASGPVIILATAAIVALNHAFREFDFKSWINGFKSINKQIIAIEKSAIKAARKNMFEDMIGVAAAYTIMMQGGDRGYFDNLVKDFDHVTSSISGVNAELRQMYAIMDSMSGLMIDKEIVQKVNKDLYNTSVRATKQGFKLGMPGIGGSMLEVLTRAHVAGSATKPIESLTEADIRAEVLKQVMAGTNYEIARKNFPDYYEQDTTVPSTTPGAKPMPATPSRSSEDLIRAAQDELVDTFMSGLPKSVQAVQAQMRILNQKAPEGQGAGKTTSTASEGASLYEMFRSQSAHEIALMKEYGATQTEILAKRKKDLLLASLITADARERLEVTRAIEMNNAQISSDNQLQEIKKVNDYYGQNVKLLRAQQKPQSEILRAEREQIVAVRNIATNLEECRRLKEQLEEIDLKIGFAESSEAIKEMNKDLRMHLAGLASANKIFAIQSKGDEGAALESARRELEYAREKAAGLKDIYGADSEQYYMASLEVDEKKAAYDSLNEGAKAAKEFNLQLRLGAVLGQSLGRVFEAIGAGESLSGIFDAGMVAIGDMLQNLGKAALAQGLVIKAMESWNPIAIIAAGVGAIALGGLIKGKFKGASGARSFGGRSGGGGYGGSGFTPSMSSGNHLGRLSYNPIGMDIRISGEDLRIVGAVNNDNNGAYIP